MIIPRQSEMYIGNRLMGYKYEVGVIALKPRVWDLKLSSPIYTTTKYCQTFIKTGGSTAAHLDRIVDKTLY
jgi:hypothetical protein